MMDGSTVAGLRSVVAPLNFLVPMAEKPVAYNYEPPPGVPARTGEGETHQVAIRDARPLIGELSLDREGFVLLHHQTVVKNFYDEDEIASVYYPECERVIKEATGAARVVAFDHIVRNAAVSAKGNPIKMPAKRVHDDYTAWSAPQRVRDLMGEEAEELLKHRFAIINLWRPIRGPVLESPLALCDAQSLSEENLGRQRPQIPGPHRRDLLDHLQSEPALLLFPENAGRRSRADPLLRLGARGSSAVFRPYRFRRPNCAPRRAAARKSRGAHFGLLPAGGVALTRPRPSSMVSLAQIWERRPPPLRSRSGKPATDDAASRPGYGGSAPQRVPLI
jgi:hypothetical protein